VESGWLDGRCEGFGEINTELLFESMDDIASFPTNDFAFAITFSMENPFAIDDICVARCLDHGKCVDLNQLL